MSSTNWQSGFKLDRNEMVTVTETAITIGYVQTRPANMHVCDGANRIRLMPLAGADADTITFEYYMIDKVGNIGGDDSSANSANDGWVVTKMWESAVVAGSNTGAGGQILGLTATFCDTIGTLTNTNTINEVMEDHIGAGANSGLYSAVTGFANTPGMILLPAGYHGFAIQYTDLSSDGANCLYQLENYAW